MLFYAQVKICKDDLNKKGIKKAKPVGFAFVLYRKVAD
jgi:hypothetical protein